MAEDTRDVKFGKNKVQMVEETTNNIIVRPPASKLLIYWKMYKLYEFSVHRDTKFLAVCQIPSCGSEISFKSVNGGLARHL